MICFALKDCRYSAQRNAVINIHINCARRILKLAKKLKSHNEKVFERAGGKILNQFINDLFLFKHACMMTGQKKKKSLSDKNGKRLLVSVEKICC